jgi:hypothetical protein
MFRIRTALAALLLTSALVPVHAESLAPVDAATLAAHIDGHLAARHAREGVQPAPLADDAEFFRRLCLDLVGRIPTVAELKDFLDDNRPDKRARWIDELLNGPDYADLVAHHLANQWRRRLLARVTGSTILYGPQLEGWLTRQFKANRPYDQLVRGLLTRPEAAGFYRAQQGKPEEIAASTARLFLGVKLECAQCHDDRSGGTWKRTQFWELAAFFNGLPDTGVRGNKLVLQDAPKPMGPARIQIPDSDTWVDGHFPDGSRPDGPAEAEPTVQLADWLTRPDNPWFARAAVNRVWHTCFGTGLIEPVDGLGSVDNPASHPELLDELTQQFIAHGFDLKYLLRGITGSQAYQRTSRLSHASQKDPRQFARAMVRGLSAEQVYQSFLTATGYRPTARPPAGGSGSVYGPGPSGSGEILSRFNDPHEQPLEKQTSIQQALFLMNGPLTEEATSPEQSRTLAAVANSGSARSTAQRVEDLYLAVLSRRPRPDESQRLVAYLELAGPARERTAALRDVFWALLNSTEFLVNH